MNKHLYRIIFNKRRGLLMVVGENVSLASKAASPESAALLPLKPEWPLAPSQRRISICLYLAFAALSWTTYGARAQIVADPNAPGTQRPTVLTTSNGVSQVDIQTPSAAGVSRNVYSQFDVGARGVVLNNSRTNVQSQIGGWVQGNPWLAGGPARVILNEVNSANPSRLNGYMEIAGQRAELVIANPSGVSIDGGGFINASKVTITTGVPQMSGGSLDGYLVERGNISVNGAGLDAIQSDYIGILARAAEVNAGIWAKELQVVTGTGQIDANGVSTAVHSGSGGAPAFALDVSHLGGMYAGKIVLVGTEAGVGMRNAGTVVASDGELVLTSNGWLSNTGSMQASAENSRLHIEATGGVENSGTLYASGDTHVASEGDITNKGIIAAQANTTLVAGGTTSRIHADADGVFAAGVKADGTLGNEGKLRLSAAHGISLHGTGSAADKLELASTDLDLSGARLAGTAIDLRATAGDIITRDAVISTSGSVGFATTQAVRTDGATVEADALQLTARDWSNVSGRISVIGAADASIVLPGTLDNSSGRIAMNSASLSFDSNTLINIDGAIEHAGIGNLQVHAKNINGGRGLISGAGTVDISTGQADLHGARTVGNQVSVSATQIDNRSGKISATGNVSLSTAGELRNRDGIVAAGADLAVTAGSTDNIRGILQADAGNVSLNLAALNNQGGKVIASGNLSLFANGELNNTEGTAIAGKDLAVSSTDIDNSHGILRTNDGRLTLRTAGLNNTAGNIHAGGTLDAAVSSLDNSGSLYATGEQRLTVGGLLTNAGVIAAMGNTTVTAYSVDSTAGSVFAAGVLENGTLTRSGDLGVTVERSLAAHGQNLAARQLSISGASVDVGGSQTSAQGITLKAGVGDVTTSRATVTAENALVIGTGHEGHGLVNQQGHLSAGQLQLQVANLDNEHGTIIQSGAGDTRLVLSSGSKTLNNTDGRIAVNSGNLSLGAATFINVRGEVEHAGTGKLEIAGGSVNGQGGKLTSNGELEITAGQVDHRAASTVAKKVGIAAESLDNREGSITQLGTDRTSISIHGLIDNRGGTLAGNADMAIQAASLLNQAGIVQAAGSASLHATVSGVLDNSDGGSIQADRNTTLSAGTVRNQLGHISAGKVLAATACDAIQNDKGQLTAGHDARMASSTLTNVGGTVSATTGNVSLSTASTTANDGGVIRAGGDIAVHSAGLDNSLSPENGHSGSIEGRSITIDTGGGVLNNRSGTIAARSRLEVRGGEIANDSGLLQAGDKLVLDTAGQALSNTNTIGYARAHPGREGGIVSEGAIDLKVGHLNNAGGFLGAGGAVIGQAGEVDNSTFDGIGGQIVGENALRLTMAGLNNRGGQIQVLGDTTLDVGSGLVDNRDGLIRSAAALRVTADKIDNRSTGNIGQGIESFDIALAATHIDNTLGSVGADRNATIQSSGRLDNMGGVISAGEVLNVADPNAARGLNIVNTGGTLIAGSAARVDTAALSGDGRLLSFGDISLKISGDYVQGVSGEIAAYDNLSVHVGGNLSNASRMFAGRVLKVDAHDIDNSVTGDISAGSTQINSAGILSNRGLIDGIDTRIDASSVRNTGTGRIYGDHVSIAAGVLDNSAEGGSAATIAARGWLDIGANTVSNADHGLIFSGGDMKIGSQLSADRIATGSADKVSNASATIESIGDMSIAARQVINTNSNLVTELATIDPPASITEYQGTGSPNRYLAGTPGVGTWDAEFLTLGTPDGVYNESWTQYDYTRETRESVIKTTDPGRIVSGRDLTFDSEGVFNENSHILAGGTLAIPTSVLQNTDTKGERITTDSGTATLYTRVYRSGRDTTKTTVTSYTPPDQVETISLKTWRVEEHTATGGNAAPSAMVGGGVSGVVSVVGKAMAEVGPSAIAATLTDVALAGPVKALGAGDAVATGGLQAADRPVSHGTVTQVALAQSSGPAQIVRTRSGPITLPSASLYTTLVSPTARYLIETDARFANYRQWLGSDYMLAQLQLDPSITQKRLGDGFYEQSLVREQIAQLTGQRFLAGYSDDDEQYRALMNAGVSVAKSWNLRPGVALTAAQMAGLTEDIVWMVEKEVVLADGSAQKLLVPQVYARVREGDIDGDGALLAGKNVDIRASGELFNNGTIAARNTAEVTADNLQNIGGRIHGAAVLAAAATDLNNIGGAISAESTLIAVAGRDINIETTTRSGTVSSDGNSFARTTVDQVAGMYVTGNSESSAGTMVVSAGRDLNLAAGQIGNVSANGNTALTAGRDISLSTIDTASSNSLRWDAKNHRSDSTTTEIGSQLQTGGALVLKAGNDIKVRAGDVQAGTALVLDAGNDIKLDSGVHTAKLDEGHQVTKSGFMKKATITTRDTLDRSSALASNLGGQTVSLDAGNSIEVRGSTIAADGNVDLTAGKAITIQAATETSSEAHHREIKEKGFLSGGGFGFSYGTRTTTTDQTKDATIQSGQARSVIGSVGGNLTVSAGDAVKVVGSDLSAGKDISLSGKSVAATPGVDDVNGKFTSKMTQDALTFSVGGSVVNAIQTVQNMDAAAKKTSSTRLSALAAASAALTVNDAIGDVATNGLTPKISLTAGHSESETTEVTASRTHGGSVLAAGNNVYISATGAGKDSNIHIVGSDVHAVGDVRLAAVNQVNLLAAQDLESKHSTSKSKSASFGVSAQLGGKGPILGVTASASASRSKVDGEGTTQLNTHVTAGDKLTIVSGGDTNLKGAVASGNRVVANIEGNLNIESLQDTATLNGSRQSTSASGTLGVGAGFSASVSKSKVHNDYASVQEQSGIRAGDGGFDVRVAGNTDLKGGVISSGKQAIKEGRNSLATETLSFSDIQNRDSTRASGVSLGTNIGENQSGDKFSPSMAPGIGKVSDSQASTTRSGISVAALTVGDKQAEEVIANLNRDVLTGKDTAQALTKGWNGAQVLDEVNAQIQITSAAMPRLANGIGNYAKTRMKELESQGNTEEAAKWAEGGIYRVAAHTALGAMGGGLGGAVGAAAAAEAAPTIDELQKAMTVKLTDAGLGDNAAEVAAKLIAGGAAGIIGGMAGGTAGAATGLNVDANNRQLHPDETIWIKKNAARFAAEKGISVDEATRRLAQQASRDVDLVWRGVLSDTEDKEAQSFLTQAQGQTFTNGIGQKQALFTTRDGQFTAAQDGLFEANKSFVNRYVTPYASRRALDGVWTEIGQSAAGIAEIVGRDPLGVVAQTGSSLAASAWNTVWHPIDTAKDLIKSAESGGKTFGEGVATSTNEDIQRQLNSLYGQDVTSSVQITTGVQGASILGFALGTGKAVSKGAMALGDAIATERVAAARIRQSTMLDDNVGFNISPTSWDAYPTIGRNGSFISDHQGVMDYFGNINGLTEITIPISLATKIEKDMGLVAGTLQDGFKIRKVTDLQSMQPVSPLEGNMHFLGGGQHLPGGAPEMVVNSIPTVDNKSVTTILTIKVKKP